jgi:hypothetical protein
MKAIYIGIENEYELWDKHTRKCITRDIFDHVTKRSSDFKSAKKNGLRTAVGNRLYQDDCIFIEIASAPTRVNSGFVQDVADSLYVARQDLVQRINNDNALVGHSMHWNATDVLDSNHRLHFAAAFLIPYGFFVGTSRSRRCAVRFRNKDGNRIELRGDHIEDEEQIRAFSLFYGTTIHRYSDLRTRIPFIGNRLPYGNDPQYKRYTNETRDTKIPVLTRYGETRTITVQEYLNAYYSTFKEEIAHFGTPEEVRLLKEFIDGRRLLVQERDIAVPGEDCDQETIRQATVDPTDYQEQRELPLLAKYFGDLARGQYSKKGTLAKLNWNSVVFTRLGIHNFTLTGLEEIEALAKTRTKHLNS